MVEKRNLVVKLDNFKMKNESCVKENRLILRGQYAKKFN